MSKYKKKNTFSLEGSIENSNFDFCKNFKWFLILPLVIIVVGIVLLCTVGFNLGYDFTGGSAITIYVDSDGQFSDQAYDVDEDFSEIKQIINSVLKKHGLSASSIQKIEISEESDGNVDLNLLGKDAVIVKYQNDISLDADEIEALNDEIRLELLKAFGFVLDDDTLESLEGQDVLTLVSEAEITSSSVTTETIMRSVVAFILAFIFVLAYIWLRFDFACCLSAFLTFFHDFFVTVALLLICQVQINVNFIVAVVAVLVYSILNNIILFDRIKNEIAFLNNNEKKIENNSVANIAVKNSTLRLILTTLIAVVVGLMFVAIGVSGVREFAFPIIIGCLAAFYSSNFITPGLWAIVYKPKKKKKQNKKKKSKDDTVVSIENAVD